MRGIIERRLWVAVALISFFSLPVMGQPGFGGFGGRGFGGRGGMGEKRPILKQYDKNGDGYLDTAERKAARQEVAAQGRFRRFGPRGASQAAPTPGRKLTPAQVKTYGTESLYDMSVLRTLFFEFEDADWEAEMDDFYHTDVDVPARLTVDGKLYEGVGVHFRGNTSYSSVPQGRKKSLSVEVNMINKDQRLLGYRSLNLMNSNMDPTFMRIALYNEIARNYIPAPKVNWVRVVINGEDWGIYVNSQQFNSDLTKDFFGSTKGARWKTPGSPMGMAGLGYLGDDPASYKRIYEIKSKDDPKSWANLIHLCKTLSNTAPEGLEKALEPILDVDGALRFLAIDKALINNDGFWLRASDYGLYQDSKGKFHLLPQDSNETLRESEGGRFGGGGTGVRVDPFAGAQDYNKTLLAKLLSVPAWRQKYLSYMRDIAENWLDWNKIAPKLERYQALIAEEVKLDTRKLDSTDDFFSGFEGRSESAAQAEPDPQPAFGRMRGFGGMSGPPDLNLKAFCDQRRAYLLEYPEIKNLARR